MIAIESTYREGIPSACDSYTGTRLTFRYNGLKLTVPNLLDEKLIKLFMMRGGMSLANAYKSAGAGYITPDTGIRPCISEALRTEWYNPETGKRESTGGLYTCAEFHRCFEDYIRAQQTYPEPHADDRRMQINPGVFAPSANEDKCIRGKFRTAVPLVQAYHECGAGDILPGWPGAIELMTRALIVRPDDHLYVITKRAYQMFSIQPPATPPVTPPETPPPVTPPPEEEEKPLNYWIAAGVAVAAILLLSSRSR